MRLSYLTINHIIPTISTYLLLALILPEYNRLIINSEYFPLQLNKNNVNLQIHHLIFLERKNKNHYFLQLRKTIIIRSKTSISQVLWAHKVSGTNSLELLMISIKSQVILLMGLLTNFRSKKKYFQRDTMNNLKYWQRKRSVLEVKKKRNKIIQ